MNTRNPYVKMPVFVLPSNEGNKTLQETFGGGLSLAPGCEHLARYPSPSTNLAKGILGFIYDKNKPSRLVFKSFDVSLQALAYTPAQFCDLVLDEMMWSEMIPSNLIVLVKADIEIFIACAKLQSRQYYSVRIYQFGASIDVYCGDRIALPQIDGLTV